MSMEFANRTCPNCKNPNYMVLLGDFSKVYKYKCMNCNRYFNDIDFEEPLQPVWKTECLNKKADMVEVVRCKDFKHRPKEIPFKMTWGGHDTYLEFPEGSRCPCQCSDDSYYSWNPDDEWFCADGERK